MSQIFVHSVEATHLAFGLEWLPLVTGKPERSAHRLARQHKASHLVMCTDSAASVGLAFVGRSSPLRRRTVHSAAQIVAQLFEAGTVALVLCLPGSLYWMVAVHEGAVLSRTDVTFENKNEIRAVLEDLRRAHPAMQLLHEGSGIHPPTLPDLAAAASSSSRLITLRPMTWLSNSSLALAAIGISGLVAWWSLVSKPTTSGAQVPTFDAYEVWQQATQAAAARVNLHGVHGTRLLLDGLLGLPVYLRGWELTGVECEPNLQQWFCSASYARRNSNATNAEFIQAAASDWDVRFPTIEQAQIRWRLVSITTKLAAHAVQSHMQNHKHFQSSLQRLKPAFRRLHVGEPVILPVSLPREAAGLARPNTVAQFNSRRLDISGPFRSAFLLLPLIQDVAWSKVTLAVTEEVSPSLLGSRLSITFLGDLYEKQSE